MKIEVGTPVFLRPTGNIARNNPTDIEEGTITKVARKYFYVTISKYHEEKFEIETLENSNRDFNSSYILYFSKQEILDMDEKNALIKKFYKLFQWNGECNNLCLEQLRQMAKIANLE